MTNITITGRRHFTLTESIPNPNYDRRCKYDSIRSTSLFRPGTVVTAIENTLTSGSLPKPIVSVSYEIDFRRVPESVASLFAAQDPGHEVDAASIEEVSKREHDSVGVICELAVRRLIATGVLTEEQVIDAYYNAYEEVK